MLTLSRGGPGDLDVRGGRGEDRRRRTTTGSRRSTATAWWSRGRSSATGCPRAPCSCTTPRTGSWTCRRTETTGKRGGIHNALTRLMIKPITPHRRVRPAVVRAELPRPDRKPARRGHHHPPPSRRWVLDEGHGSAGDGDEPRQVHRLPHLLASPASRPGPTVRGVEYVVVQQRGDPSRQGYPRRYQDQEKWKGGWTLNKRGRLTLKSGGRVKQAAQHLRQPGAAHRSDYYEPWTYDYENLLTAPAMDTRRWPGPSR